MSEMEKRRREAARGFAGRVALLSLLIGAIAYAAWFAPFAQPLKSVPVVPVSEAR